MPESPDKLKEFHEKRQLAFARNEWGDIVKICESILELKSSDPLACHDLCVAHWRRGEREKAREWANKTSRAFISDQSRTPIENQMKHMLTLMKVGKASPRYMRHYEVLGEILYEEGAFEAARDFFEELTSLKGNFSRKYIYIFKCDLHMRDFDSAQEQYARMAEEFPGREGHLIVNFRDYLNRHIHDNEAMDLYVALLDEAGMREKELDRWMEMLVQSPGNLEAEAFLRAHSRFIDDVTGELKSVKQSLKHAPDSVPLLLDLARLVKGKNSDRGAKAIVRALQLEPQVFERVKPIIRGYFEQDVEKGVQENLCKGLLVTLEEGVAREMMLDLSYELPDNELLKELKSQWGGTTESFGAVPGNVTQMLDGLSLTDLIKAKMRMEEHIATKKGETTFLTLDVVGSTRLKEGVSPEKIVVTFEGFHKMVDHIVKARGGSSFHDEGDCKISRYSRAVDAVRASRIIMEKLAEFNETDNKIGVPISIRVGMHTGLSLIDDNMTSGRVADHVLDIACHLEKYGVPGEIHLSQETVQAADIPDHEVTELGWREKSGVMVYKLN